MPERDILAVGDGISGLLHEGKEAIKVMRLFRQRLVNIKAEAVAIGELFNIALPAIVAHTVELGIFDHRYSVLNTDQVAELADSQCAAPEIPELSGAVERSGIPIDVVMNVVLIRVSADDEGVIAF